jgi:hypothetical protein
MLRIGPSLFTLAACYLIVRALRFLPTATQNRLTDYSLLLLVVPVAIGAVAIGWGGVRWLRLAISPTWRGFEGDKSGLSFKLGPFGNERYKMEDLDIRYLFELSDDEQDEGAFEAFLDPEEQMSKFLPRIWFGSDRQRLDLRLRKFVRLTEQELARQLKPFIDHARRNRPSLDHDET